MTRLRVTMRDGEERLIDVDPAGALTVGYLPVRKLDEWATGERSEAAFSLYEVERVEVTDPPVPAPVVRQHDRGYYLDGEQERVPGTDWPERKTRAKAGAS